MVVTVISAAARMVVSLALTTLLFGIVTMLVDWEGVGWWCSGADVVVITVIVPVTGGGIILVEIDGPPHTRARP